MLANEVAVSQSGTHIGSQAGVARGLAKGAVCELSGGNAGKAVPAVNDGVGHHQLATAIATTGIDAVNEAIDDHIVQYHIASSIRDKHGATRVVALQGDVLNSAARILPLPFSVEPLVRLMAEETSISEAR